MHKKTLELQSFPLRARDRFIFARRRTRLGLVSLSLSLYDVVKRRLINAQTNKTRKAQFPPHRRLRQEFQPGQEGAAKRRSQKMKKIVYSFYSSYLNCYDLPQVATTCSTEEDLKVIFRRTVLSDPEKAYLNRAQEKTLVILGDFDDETGMLTVLDAPKKILDLASAFPPGWLKNKEALING